MLVSFLVPSALVPPQRECTDANLCTVLRRPLPLASLLRTALETISDAVFVVDDQSRHILNCNSAATRIFGHARDAMSGASTRMLHVDERYYERFAEQSLAPLEQQGVYRGDFQMRRADGSHFPTEHFVYFVDARGGPNPTLAANLVRDASDKCHQERNLESVHALSKAIMQSETFEAALTVTLERLGDYTA